MTHNSGQFEKGHIPWNKGRIGRQKNHNTSGLKTGWGLMKGKHHTQSAKDKVSVVNKGRLPWNTGKHRSEKTKEKLRIARVNQKMIRKNTTIEVAVYKELKKRGFIFETQKPVGDRFVVDAYIPSLNLVIECDGVYWHSLPKTKERDVVKNKYLKNKGYELLRLGELDIKSGKFMEVLPNV